MWTNNFSELTPLHLKGKKFHLNIHMLQNIFNKDSNEKYIDNHENNVSLVEYKKLRKFH